MVHNFLETWPLDDMVSTKGFHATPFTHVMWTGFISRRRHTNITGSKENISGLMAKLLEKPLTETSAALGRK